MNDDKKRDLKSEEDPKSNKTIKFDQEDTKPVPPKPQPKEPEPKPFFRKKSSSASEDIPEKEGAEKKEEQGKNKGLGDKPDEKLPFAEDLKRRLSRVKLTRWIRFAVVSILFFLLVIWIGNPWLFIFWLLLIDIYITAYVPWTWWKNTKGYTRMLLGWLDAIIYALVLVYIIFAFIGQNYKIPSSSLEKSLLVGDFLWVNKTTYGPRVPNTPLHFPLAQHTMPIFGGKSYIDKPQFEYHRLPGLREVERGDIVVFNFPQGDTVFSRLPDKDYYEESYRLRMQGLNPSEYYQYNQMQYGDIIVRPVDRRENYVKRVVGLPGERLQMVNDTVYINGKPIGFADNVQFNYIIPVTAPIPDDRWLQLGVRREDHGPAPFSGLEMGGALYYTVPLTAEMKRVVESWPEVSGALIKENDAGFLDKSNFIWPIDNSWGWTTSNTDEFWIPKRGKTLELTLNNLPLYRRAVETYEGNTVEVKNGRIFINGEDNPYYTFKMDYYWMMGDNRDRSKDSRYFGLVPEDHIVGTPARILISIDEERSITDINKIRWNRILANPNPDKKKAAEKNW